SGIEITRSADVACTWPPSSGSVTGQVVLDIFSSPTDPSLTLAVVGTASNSSYLVASHDGGRTFDAAHLKDTAANEMITGVEISRSQPSTVYLSVVSTNQQGATLWQSTSSGAAGTWTSNPIAAAGNSQPRIPAIDPADANVDYVRLRNAHN